MLEYFVGKKIWRGSIGGMFGLKGLGLGEMGKEGEKEGCVARIRRGGQLSPRKFIAKSKYSPILVMLLKENPQQ
jgi:hypothetical protein